MRADTNVQKLLDTLEKESESARVNRVATTPATAYLAAPVVAAAAQRAIRRQKTLQSMRPTTAQETRTIYICKSTNGIR